MSNKKEDLPAMPFYWGDWFKDPGVQALPRDIRCTWFEMIGRMWESPDRGVLLINGCVPDDNQLAMMLGFGEDNLKVNLVVNHILKYKVAERRESDGAIFCRRMVRDEEIRKKRADGGKKGGNPVLKSPKVNLTDNLTTQNKVNLTDNLFPEDENENVIENEIRNFEVLFQTFWTIYPRKEEMQPAKEKFEQLLHDKIVTPHQIITAVNAYNAYCIVKYPDEYPFCKYIKKAKNWLNDSGWLEDWKKLMKSESKNSYGSKFGTNVWGPGAEMGTHVFE